MRLIRYQPSAPLDPYVECFWWSSRHQPQAACESMLPSGNCQLVIALHDRPMECRDSPDSRVPVVWSRGVVHGPQWRYFVAGPKPAGAVIGVSFRAGAAGAALGLSVAEVVDRHVSIDDLWGARGRALQEQLRDAGSPDNAFRVLDSHLRNRIVRPIRVHPAIAQALGPAARGWDHRRIADLQRRTGYSARHFIALFRDAVGLTPKHFYRIKRFSSVLRALANGYPAPLADLAAMAGYADQSHLTREFRDFAGVTPARYCPRGADSLFHHRLVDS